MEWHTAELGTVVSSMVLAACISMFGGSCLEVNGGRAGMDVLSKNKLPIYTTSARLRFAVSSCRR